MTNRKSFSVRSLCSMSWENPSGLHLILNKRRVPSIWWAVRCLLTIHIPLLTLSETGISLRLLFLGLSYWDPEKSSTSSLMPHLFPLLNPPGAGHTLCGITFPRLSSSMKKDWWDIWHLLSFHRTQSNFLDPFPLMGLSFLWHRLSKIFVLFYQEAIFLTFPPTNPYFLLVSTNPVFTLTACIIWAVFFQVVVFSDTI